MPRILSYKLKNQQLSQVSNLGRNVSSERISREVKCLEFSQSPELTRKLAKQLVFTKG